jgi:hypothetical protein
MNGDRQIKARLPNDEELELLTDYIGGYMSGSEAEAFENRMREDDEFFFRMAPMLDAWYLGKQTVGPIPTDEELDRELAGRSVIPIASRRKWRIVPIATLLAALAAEIVVFIVQIGPGSVTTMSPTFAKAPTLQVDTARTRTIEHSEPKLTQSAIVASRSVDTTAIVVVASNVDSTNAERAISELNNAPHAHAGATRIEIPPVPPRAHPITAPYRVIAQARAPVDTSKLATPNLGSGLMPRVWAFFRWLRRGK